jgi:FkbH-like protein
MKPNPARDGYSAVFAAVAATEDEAATFGDVIRVLVLRQITVEGIDTLIKHHLYPLRIRPIVTFGGYNTMAQDVLASEGAVTRSDPELIVLALSLDELDPTYGQPGWKYEVARAQLESLFALLSARTRATIAVHNFIAPMWPERGLATEPQNKDLSSQVALLNAYIVEQVCANAPRFLLMDWERYLRRLGADAALDQRGRYLWRAPFKHAFLDAWAQQLARVTCALKGRTKKVLALDCDDTLWGGVVGEVGLTGIALDATQYPGRVFFDFQTAVLHLFERGVLLVLCSKNNDADVFEVLDQHPHCLIKRSHLVGSRIDWNDKAKNIVALADELNLGLDSFVFVDDNSVECEMIRQMLPQVTVLQVPAKIHELPPLLLQAGLFDTLSLTDEDGKRASLYQEDSSRKAARLGHVSLDDYLRSLQTVAVVHRARPSEVPRIAQLTQKTNQFNLTTRRYSEQEIHSLLSDSGTVIYSLSVRDRFGALGLVGVLVARFDGESAQIVDFLMSCRALGRRLEEAMVKHCLAEIGATRVVARWEAEYIATSKNAQVADFWPRLGFAEIEAIAGRRRYKRAADIGIGGPPDLVTIQGD